MTTDARRPATRRTRSRRGSGELLRDEIVTAARDLLAQLGDSGAVSIRRVADAVGVTPPSIYLHFADKGALLEEVVAAVFADLDRAMLAAAEGIEDPLAVLCAYGTAYVDFAVEHPEHYRLATMERNPSADGTGELDEMLSEGAFRHMLEAVTACIEAGVYAAGDPLPLALSLWTSAHGIASLMITKGFLPWGDRREFTLRTLGAAAVGLGVLDRLGGDVTPEQGRAWLDSQPRAGTRP